MPAGTKHRGSMLKLALRTAIRLDRQVIAALDRSIAKISKNLDEARGVRDVAVTRLEEKTRELAKLTATRAR